MSSPPKRLIEEGTSFDRALLRAAREEKSSDDFERRVVAATVAASAAVATGKALRPSLLARLARPRVLVAFAVSALVAARFLATRPEAPSVVDPAPVLQVEPPARPSPAPEPAPAEPGMATVTPDALPSVTLPALSTGAPRPAAPIPPAAAVTAPPAVAAAGPSDTGASLEREVALLDAVKRGLRASDVASAERALAAYDAEFPAGTLRPEAGVLRVRLLLAKGDRAGASALGEELLARWPNGIHASRIRAALAGSAAPPAPPR